MRGRACFYRKRAKSRGRVGLLHVLMGIVIFSALFASGLPAVQNLRRNAEYRIEFGMEEAEARQHFWQDVWRFYSFERKVLLASAATLLIEVGAGEVATFAARKRKGFGQRLRGPPVRRYWFSSSRPSGGCIELIPLAIAASYLVTFIVFRMYCFGAMPPQFELLEFTAPATGVSLAMMLRLVNFALVGYLSTHVVYGLLPATRAPMHQRFLLILAIIVIVTSSYSVPGPM